MIYNSIRRAVFKSRPNRFIANVLIDGVPSVCHVKNTGRCRELLIPGARVIVQAAESDKRRTAWDLISVYKGDRLINIDSSAPNAVFGEWIRTKLPYVRPECVHGDSRFDFYMETGEKRIFAEIKGVTLEENGIVRFPDAPTQRGTKHLRGLSRCVSEGFEAWIVFVVQMRGVKHFEPNRLTDPEFSKTLGSAAESGVKILALDCDVTENSIAINKPVEVRL